MGDCFDHILKFTTVKVEQFNKHLYDLIMDCNTIEIKSKWIHLHWLISKSMT